jgi:hypothetical protein
MAQITESADSDSGFERGGKCRLDLLVVLDPNSAVGQCLSAGRSEPPAVAVLPQEGSSEENSASMK